MFSNAYRSVNDSYVDKVLRELERSFNDYQYSGTPTPTGKSWDISMSSPGATPRTHRNVEGQSDAPRETLQMDIKNLKPHLELVSQREAQRQKEKYEKIKLVY